MKILSARYSNGKMRFPKHYHDAHQMLYVSCGSAAVTFGRREVTIGEGTLVIFNRFDEHSVRVLSEHYRRYSILIFPHDLNEGLDDYLLSSVLLNRADHLPQMVHLGEKKECFEAILREMADEYKKKDSFYEKKLNLLFWQFLITLYRYQSDLFLSDINRNTLMVQKISHYIEEHFSEKISLADLAAEYHVSLSHLTHFFKKTTGYAPIEYLIECRISAAKQWLSSSDRSITEIVDLCGFSDESNFSRMFKKKIGVTPSAFRKSYRLQE